VPARTWAGKVKTALDFTKKLQRQKISFSGLQTNFKWRWWQQFIVSLVCVPCDYAPLKFRTTA
jgi:hypothetical protein